MQTNFPDSDFQRATAEPPALLTPVAPFQPEPEKPKSLKELASKYREKAIDTLAEILDDENAGHMSKIAAANSILDRTDGKPTQFVEQTTKVLTYQDLLTQIAVREEKFVEVIEAQSVKEIAAEKEWRELL